MANTLYKPNCTLVHCSLNGLRNYALNALGHARCQRLETLINALRHQVDDPMSQHISGGAIGREDTGW